MRKFQIIQEVVSSAGQEITFDEDIEKGYPRLTEITIFSSATLSSNENLLVTQEIKVDDLELYPEKFSTQLLHPEFVNDKYQKVGMMLTKNKIKGKIKDQNTSLSTPYTVTVLLTLDSEESC